MIKNSFKCHCGNTYDLQQIKDKLDELDLSDLNNYCEQIGIEICKECELIVMIGWD